MTAPSTTFSTGPATSRRRTAIGVASLAFFFTLFAASSTDVLANYFKVSLNEVLWFFRFAVFIIPAAAGVFAYYLCREMSGVPGIGRRKRAVVITRSARGRVRERVDRAPARRRRARARPHPGARSHRAQRRARAGRSGHLGRAPHPASHASPGARPLSETGSAPTDEVRPVVRAARLEDTPEVLRLAQLMYLSLGLDLDEEVWERWRSTAMEAVRARLGADLTVVVAEDPAVPGRLVACGAGIDHGAPARPGRRRPGRLHPVDVDRARLPPPRPGSGRAAGPAGVVRIRGRRQRRVARLARRQRLYRSEGFWEGSTGLALRRRPWDPPPATVSPRGGPGRLLGDPARPQARDPPRRRRGAGGRPPGLGPCPTCPRARGCGERWARGPRS